MLLFNSLLVRLFFFHLSQYGVVLVYLFSSNVRNLCSFTLRKLVFFFPKFVHSVSLRNCDFVCACVSPRMCLCLMDARFWAMQLTNRFGSLRPCSFFFFFNPLSAVAEEHWVFILFFFSGYQEQWMCVRACFFVVSCSPLVRTSSLGPSDVQTGRSARFGVPLVYIVYIYIIWESINIFTAHRWYMKVYLYILIRDGRKKNVKKNFKGITMQVCTIVKIIFVFLTAASK